MTDCSAGGSNEWRPLNSVVDAEWLIGGLRADRAEEVARRERLLFDELAGGAEAPIVLFGAGNLGRRTLAGLRAVGIEPQAFVDNDASLHGELVDGLEVHSAADAAVRYGRSAVFVVTIWSPVRPLVFSQIKRRLCEFGVARVVSFVPLFWKYAEQFLPYHCLELPHNAYRDADKVRRAYSLLADDGSRREYLLQLSRLLSQMDSVDLEWEHYGEGYFPRDLVALHEREVFVDCGAYDGDTLDEFNGASAGCFARVVAFEPDPTAADALLAKQQALPEQARGRVFIHRAAVAEADGEVRFESDGTPGSRLSPDGGTIVRCVSLDSALQDDKPTFIKMDIEGSEEKALRGARRTIERSRPILAVSLYHQQADIHCLPWLISTLCRGYKLFLRRQGSDGDLVCFAIPHERLPSGR